MLYKKKINASTFISKESCWDNANATFYNSESMSLLIRKMTCNNFFLKNVQ
jgi:hypothetical protein